MEVKLDEHQLDEGQMKAVKHFEGPALVVAGPGSGKTNVIKERILNLIQEYDVNPGKILALAFNKEAAKEMEQRVFPKLRKIHSSSGKPEICTLHAFGLKIINQNYERLNLESEPGVWAADPERTILQEIAQLKREGSKATVIVYIYRIGDKVTDKCYIGQTTNLQRRKEEHLNDSSNPELRQAILKEGIEQFTFEIKETVNGRIADSSEAKWIEYYKNLAVFNQEDENIYFETESDDELVAIYKIEQLASGRCYFGYSNSPEKIKEEITLVDNDELKQAIADKGVEQFLFDIIFEDIPITKAPVLVAREIEFRKNMAVYNKSNPLSQRYSNRLQIELFCQHFNLSYEEVLKHPADIKNLSDRIEKFEKIVRNVEKVKLQVVEDFSNYNSIEDIVNFILGSIDDIVVKTFAEKYEDKKKKANAIDFLDMILYAVYLFERYPDIRTKWREKYEFVLVDEFQDISPIDFRLIKTLSENLFAVGDDDQAIYGFRGGNSEIMQNYNEQENVTKFEITKNYRSTMTIVEHSRALIEHNKNRIRKNLRAKNTMELPIKVLETTNKTEDSSLLPPSESNQMFIDPQVITAEKLLIRDFSNSVCSKIAILVRYRSEVDQVREMLRRNGFEEQVRSNPYRKKGDPCNFIGTDNEQIRVSTVHSVKGKEYDKVILIHNTLSKDFPFYDSDSIAEERRVFYVAMTRAKQELVVIGGECLFVWELRKAYIPELERLSESLTSAINNRINNIKRQLREVSEALPSKIKNRFHTTKEQLDKVSEALPLALESQIARQIEASTKTARKQYELKLERLRCDIIEVENITNKIRTALPQQLIKVQETFLLKLIPILDNLESIANSTAEKIPLNGDLSEFATFCENIKYTQEQFLNFLKIHGIIPIDTIGQPLNLDQHEEMQPGIFTDEVSKDIIVKELHRGYIQNNQVIRKAQVIVSKGQWSAYGIFLDFEEPVCFVTGQEIYFLQNIMVLAERIKGFDLQGSVVRLQKLDVMFALPKTDWETIMLQSQQVESFSYINSISEDFLKSVLVREELTNVEKQKYCLRLVTQSGHILRGYLRAFDKVSLCMLINEKIVVVYQHALLEIKRDAETESIDVKNPSIIEKEVSQPDDSGEVVQTVVNGNNDYEIDSVKHSQILKEQIQKLEIPSERIISPTDEASVSEKTENEISVECSVSRLLDSPDNKDDNISEIEEKDSSSLGGQVVKKNFGDYFRQIQDFIRRNLKWK